jgi:ketosteroid isomerase-like protein
MTGTTIETPTHASAEEIEIARDFLTAFVGGDSATFAELAHDRIVLRDLNPHGLITVTGREEAIHAAALFASSGGQMRLRHCDGRAVGHRIQVTYAYGSFRDGVASHFEVHAFLEVQDGRVIVLDEVCSGRIPEGLS